MSLKTVMLYGHLGEKYGKEWVLDVGSPREAMRALRANFPEFEADLIGYQPGYHVIVGDGPITSDQVGDPVSRHEVIKIIPVIAGAGFFDSIVPIILGAVLIWATAGAAAAPLAGYLSPAMLTFVGQLGVALVVMGVSSLLAPKPQEEKKDKPSHAFDGPINTSVQGAAVPLGYGRLRVGSAVLSAGIYIQQMNEPDPAYQGTYPGVRVSSPAGTTYSGVEAIPYTDPTGGGGS